MGIYDGRGFDVAASFLLVCPFLRFFWRSGMDNDAANLFLLNQDFIPLFLTHGHSISGRAARAPRNPHIANLISFAPFSLAGLSGSFIFTSVTARRPSFLAKSITRPVFGRRSHFFSLMRHMKFSFRPTSRR